MDTTFSRLAVIGRGRLGRALAAAFEAGEPLGRGADGRDADVVLLCVPDDEIAAAAACVAPGRLVGHCSGASTLAPLAPHESFSIHPLMTVPGCASGNYSHSRSPQVDFAGVRCAIAGSTPRALEAARDIAERLAMEPFEVADEDRAAYHAAASIASNFLVTLEWCAERLAATADVPREALVPLARAALENWAATSAEQALTGPIARGDEQTVARQREAVAQNTPDLLHLFDALAETTRNLARTPA